MRHEHFELSTFVNIDIDIAFRFLCDMNNHKHLHPYFVRAEQVSSQMDALGNPIYEFMITERPRLGPFRYTIKFPTTMTFTAPHQFKSEVRAAFQTHLLNTMRCEREKQGTRITETVDIRAPGLTIRYVKQQAYIAHKRSFDLLPSVLMNKT